MKVIFINAPYIKNPYSNPSNDFALAPNALSKLRSPHIWHNLMGGGVYITR